MRVEEQLSVEVYCGVQLRPFTGDVGSDPVDHDPLRLCRRRARDAVGQSVTRLENRLKRAIYAEWLRNTCDPVWNTISSVTDGDWLSAFLESQPLVQ